MMRSVLSTREAQYELYIGMCYGQAGLQVQHGNPDLVAGMEGRGFFIEAERPSIHLIESTNRLIGH